MQPSTSAPQQWQALQLGGDVVAWLPVGESWTLTEQGRTEAGGTFVRINEADTALTVVAQSLKTPGEVSASALCASGLQSALISAGVDAVPQPVGDPLPETSDLIDRFRCQAQSPDSAGLNYRFDVAIRTTDRLSYTQLVSAPASVGDQEQAAHAQELTELMLGRTVAGLE